MLKVKMSLRLGKITMDKILISLTTISTRIAKIHEVIDSILSQKLNGQFTFEVRLYISKEPYMLDQGITSLTCELEDRLNVDKFSIEYVENIGSYRKFYYAMKDRVSGNESFDFLVTCDDDTIYPPWWLQTLYEKCVELDCCVAFRGRQIVYEGDTRKTYDKWKHSDDSLMSKSYLNVGTGKDGIIYRPEYLHPGVINLEGVLANVGHADDLWLKAHAALLFVPTVILQPDLSKSFPETDGSSENSLYNKFNRKGGNNQALESLENFLRDRYRIDINDFFSFNLKGNSTVLSFVRRKL